MTMTCGGGRPALYTLNAAALRRFAESYASLGDAVAAQVWELLAGRHDDLNPNAVRLIAERLGGLHHDLDEALERYASAHPPMAPAVRGALHA